MRVRNRGGTGMNPASPCTGSMITAATADGIDLRDERVLELPDPEVDVLLLGHARPACGRRCGIGSRTISGANGPKPLLNRPYLLVRLSVSSVRP